jgi:hypothetical protein
MNTTEDLLATNDRTPLSAKWSAVREDLRSRREARAARKRLEAELATYTTQADINDLSAMVDGSDDADAALVREILARQQQRIAA